MRKTNIATCDPPIPMVSGQVRANYLPPLRRLLRWLDRDMYIQYDNACGTTATAHNYIHLHTTT